MIQRNYRRLIAAVTTIFMISCAIPAITPESVPVVSTFDPNSVDIAIAQTANAAATQTAQVVPPTFTPTATLLPTSTITETPTPTFIFILATATVPSNTPTLVPTDQNAEYACSIESQSPADGASFAKGADFDAKWHVRNTGTKPWSSESADYRYASGDKFHQAAIYDFQKSVKPDGQIDIIVDMKAPNNSGTYNTTWQITIGQNKFCQMKLTIVVK